MKTLAYLCYGDKNEYQLELTYSVLTAYRFLECNSSDIQIVLIAPEGYRRDDLPVKHIHFTKTDFDSWTDNGEYFHGAKIHAAVLALSRADAPVVLIDTDTEFLSSPEHLFKRIGVGTSLLHAVERPLGESLTWQSFVRSKTYKIAGYEINDASPMFNSGVIGLDPSMRLLGDDVISVTKGILNQERVFSAEQIAFSIVLNKHTKINLCDDIVRHYWGYDRRFFHYRIAQIFPRFEKSLFEKIARSTTTIEGLPKIRSIDKLLARIAQIKAGADGNYRFAYLSCLAALSSTTPTIANLWAQTALESLQKSTTRGHAAVNVASLLRPIESSMNEKTCSDWQFFLNSQNH